MVLDGPSDADLLRAFTVGSDRAALATLFERHRALAYRVALGVLCRPEDAEDAAQVAFVNLLAYASRARVDASLAGLVARMSLRAAQRLARSGRRRCARETAWASEQDLYAPDPFDAVARQDAARLVRDAVGGLDDRYRLPVVLYYFEGLSTRETAQALGITQTAVTTRLSRAVGKLRRSLDHHRVALPIPALLALLRPRRADAAPASLAARLAGLAAATPPTRAVGLAPAVGIGGLKAQFITVTAAAVVSLGGIGALRKLPLPAGAGAATRPIGPAQAERSPGSLVAGERHAPTAAGAPHRTPVAVPGAAPATPGSRLASARRSRPPQAPPSLRVAGGAETLANRPPGPARVVRVAAAGAPLVSPDPVPASQAPVPVVGPRGPLGADVPLAAPEAKALARRVAVEGRTAAAVQAACDRAAREGIPAVFLPAGEYLFEAFVSVPGGLTLLGEGTRTLLRAQEPRGRLFQVAGDRVRFTRLKLQGADTSANRQNRTSGIYAEEHKNVRVDHCELLGFCVALRIHYGATAQVDHCFIHHNTHPGSGYGVSAVTGAWVLVTDCELSQNRCAFCVDGLPLDSMANAPKEGKYARIPDLQPTRVEFRSNYVHGDDQTTWQSPPIHIRPGMDGTFVVEGNLFEDLFQPLLVQDGSGAIRGNLVRFLYPVPRPQPWPHAAILVAYGTHGGLPVEGAMPHDVVVAENAFAGVAPSLRWRVGKAENVYVDGKLIPETRAEGRALAPIARLHEMGAEGVLGISEERPTVAGTGSVAGTVTGDDGRPIEGAAVLIGERTATTGADGRFRFPEVTEHARFLTVGAAGRDPALVSLKVLPGREVTQDVRLHPDRTPPRLLSLRLGELTDSSATLAWQTDEPALSRLEAAPEGAAAGAAQSVSEQGAPAATHTVRVADLRAGTPYRVRIRALDAAGNVATDRELRLATPPQRDATLPAGWGHYVFACKALWGRTAQEAHSGRFSVFLKGVWPAGSLFHAGILIGSPDDARVAGALPAQPGALYRYSLWVKGGFKGGELSLCTWPSDTAGASWWDWSRGTRFGTQSVLSPLAPTAEWTQLQGEFKMPDNARRFALLLSFFSEGTLPEDLGALYVDDAEVGPDGANLLKNGGAEN